MRRLAALAALCLRAARPTPTDVAVDRTSPADSLLAAYTTVPPRGRSTKLTDDERQMIPLLIDAADANDEIYWLEAIGSRVTA